MTEIDSRGAEARRVADVQVETARPAGHKAINSRPDAEDEGHVVAVLLGGNLDGQVARQQAVADRRAVIGVGAGQAQEAGSGGFGASIRAVVDVETIDIAGKG